MISGTESLCNPTWISEMAEEINFTIAAPINQVCSLILPKGHNFKEFLLFCEIPGDCRWVSTSSSGNFSGFQYQTKDGEVSDLEPLFVPGKIWQWFKISSSEGSNDHITMYVCGTDTQHHNTPICVHLR